MPNTYQEWGEDYLRDAAVLRRKIDELRHTGPDRFRYTPEEKRRLRTLLDMYLECSAVGHLLQRRGRRRPDA